jgi:hypothetical protein
VTKKLNRDRMRGPGDLAPARLSRLATVPNPNQGVQSDLSDEGVEQILREHNLPDNRLIWTPDLFEAGIFTSQTQLLRCITDGIFPHGKYITHKRRAWTGREVAVFLHTRPNRPPAALTAQRTGRPRKTETITSGA